MMILSRRRCSRFFSDVLFSLTPRYVQLGFSKYILGDYFMKYSDIGWLNNIKRSLMTNISFFLFYITMWHYLVIITTTITRRSSRHLLLSLISAAPFEGFIETEKTFYLSIYPKDEHGGERVRDEFMSTYSNHSAWPKWMDEKYWVGWIDTDWLIWID